MITAALLTAPLAVGRAVVFLTSLSLLLPPPSRQVFRVAWSTPGLRESGMPWGEGGTGETGRRTHQPPMMPIRIVIAESNPVFRKIIREQLRLEPDLEVVGEAGDGWEAVAAVRRRIPNVLTLDLDLSGMRGLEVLQVVRWFSPTTHVIIFSGRDDEQTTREALREGAHGYIVKGSGTDLGKAIRAVHRGEVWAGRRVLATVIEELSRLADLTFPAAGDEPLLA